MIASHSDERTSVFIEVCSRNDDGTDLGVLRDFIHDIQHEILDNGTKGPGSGFFFHGLLCDPFQCVIFKYKLYFIQFQQLLILL